MVCETRMARCPQCNAKIAWDAIGCHGCHGIFDAVVGWLPVGENIEESTKIDRLRPIQSPPLVTVIEAAAEPSDLSAVNTFLAIGFGFLAVMWIPWVLLIPFMFDHPKAGGLLVYFLIITLLSYGPAYLVALVRTNSLMNRSRHRDAVCTWMRLCGGSVLLFLFAILLLTIFCKGTFVCR